MKYRTALITGASRGLGRALALRIARDGVEVALLSRDAERLTAVAGEITANRGRAHVFPLDVSNARATETEVRRIDDQLGGLDLVIANAGEGHLESPERMSWHSVAPTIGVNVAGAVATLVAALPRMVGRGRGHLVGVSSLAQYRAGPGSPTYAASKAFLTRYLEGLHLALRGTGVSVTDVQPGFVRTDMTAPNPTMPFLLEPEQAAEIIWRGIGRGRAVVAFPLPMVLAMRIVSILPRPIYERLAQAAGRAG